MELVDLVTSWHISCMDRTGGRPYGGQPIILFPGGGTSLLLSAQPDNDAICLRGDIY